jgi:hypothetical protein
VGSAPSEVVFSGVLTFSGSQPREIADGNTQPQAIRTKMMSLLRGCVLFRSARWGRWQSEIGREVGGEIIAHTDDELATTLLRNTATSRILKLGMHAVSGFALGTAEHAGLLLHPREVLAAGSTSHPRDVFHDEHEGLEEVHVLQEVLVEVASGILCQPPPVV